MLKTNWNKLLNLMIITRSVITKGKQIHKVFSHKSFLNNLYLHTHNKYYSLLQNKVCIDKLKS